MMNDKLDGHSDAGELARAAQEWRSALIDVSGNNRLLYFKKSSASLDITDASPSAVRALLQGDAVRLTELFTEERLLVAAAKSCLALERKQREASEEYGVSVTYVAVGFATWHAAAAPEGEFRSSHISGGAAPNAPIVLRSLALERRRGPQDQWILKLTDEFQVNSVLLHRLNSGERIVSEGDLLEPITNAAEDDIESGLLESMARIESACTSIPGFSVDLTRIIGAFSYQKQPMVNDVDNLQALAQSDLVMALAGNSVATERVRSHAVDSSINLSDPDYQPVDSEFLVLDADASQSFVVNAALAGRNLVVQGPPGTGKSQTIANTIAALVASGHHVLFVAQKRAAITAVLSRLQQVDLSHLLLDLFAVDSSRRFVAEQIRDSLDRHMLTSSPDVATLQYQLADARDRLVKYKDAMASPVHAWGVSLHELRVKLLGLDASVQIDLRLPGDLFSRWSATSLDEYANSVDELFRSGYFDAQLQNKVGWQPALITDEKTATNYREMCVELESSLSALVSTLTAICNRSGHPGVVGWIDASQVVELHVNATAVQAQSPDLLDATDLDAMLSALSKQHRDGLPRLGWGDKRKARSRAKILLGGLTGVDQIALLELAQRIRHAWATDRVIAPFPESNAVAAELNRLRELAAVIDGATQGISLQDLSFRQLRSILPSLMDAGTLSRFIRINNLLSRLRNSGLTRLLDVLESRYQNLTKPGDGDAGNVLRWVVMRSIVEAAEIKFADILGVQGSDLDKAANAFRTYDRDHLAANSARVRRRASEAMKLNFDKYPDEHAVLKTEITRKRNFKPVRQLLIDAPHAALAAKPVWAMSPLQVSQLLPAKQCFDVVIFDEASQVKPADAIPALIRGRNVIVAGDSRQLPPTEFFTKVVEGEESEDEAVDLAATGSHGAQPRRSPVGSYTRDAESILFAMDRLLAGQSRTLQWHYRSSDEKLIAVSNEFVYSRSLTTFPAANGNEVVKHVVVEPSLGINGTTLSPAAEVQQVIDLVRERVTTSPGESLGIIAFGTKHAERIEAAIYQAIREDSAFERALNHNSAEPWFVKAIERVQGDERDTIILSVGYGKAPGEPMRLLWGPLLKEGGERRLNVAISRAKKRMVLVTSFSPDDLSATGNSSAGYQLMCKFINFMASGGTELASADKRPVVLNPFELEVKKRLEEIGLQLDSQVGVGGYRLDFAVRHPEYPGRHILAIEADGASYHSGHTARERDRLRQTLLENRGWRFHRIWSTDWFNDPDQEVRKVQTSFTEALRECETEVNEPLSPPVAAWTVGDTTRKLERPSIPKYSSITEYSTAELAALVRYVRSDGILRSALEEQRELVDELGFTRLGRRIAATLKLAQIEADSAQS